eukprot:jgi/Mesvir1/13744/Mv06189-RA.1
MAERERSGRARKPPGWMEDYLTDKDMEVEEPAGGGLVVETVNADVEDADEDGGVEVYIEATRYEKLKVKNATYILDPQTAGYPWSPGYRASEGVEGGKWTVTFAAERGTASIAPGCSVEVCDPHGESLFAEVTEIVNWDAPLPRGVEMKCGPATAKDGVVVIGYLYLADESVSKDAWDAIDWPENPLTLLVTEMRVAFPLRAVTKMLEVRSCHDTELGQNVDYLVEVACHALMLHLKASIMTELMQRFSSMEASRKPTKNGSWLSIRVPAMCFYALPQGILGCFQPVRRGERQMLEAEWESPSASEALKAVVTPTWWQLPWKGDGCLEFYGKVKMRFFPYATPHIKLWLEDCVAKKSTGLPIWWTRRTDEIEETVKRFQAAHRSG